MLSMNAVETVLLVKPRMGHLVEIEKKKLSYLFSLSFNSKGLSTDLVFEMIFKTQNKIDTLVALDNVINTAIGMLGEKEKEVIKSHYVSGIRFSDLTKALQISDVTLSRRIKKGLKSLAINIEILGFSESKILEEFNDDPTFISMAEKVANGRKKE